MTGNPSGRPGRLSERSRGIASIVLVVVGAVLLFAGTIAFYGRTEIIDREAFADRAVMALENDGVRELVGQQIVVNLVDRGSTDLVAVRPLLESVVGAVIQTDPFRRLFRAAALETNQVFFERERGNALFDLADAAQVIRFGLKSVSPKIAKELPRDIEPTLLTLRRREFAGTTLAVADDIRVLGIVLPLVAIVVFLAAVALAPDRRIGVLRVGVGIGAVGATLAIALFILRARTLAGVYGEDETSDEQVRDAVAGILDAYVGDLFSWALLLALAGLVVGAAAAALDPEDVEEPVSKLRRRLFDRPAGTPARALRGVIALAVGVLVVLNPMLALQVLAVVLGAFLVFYGTSEVLVLLQRGGAAASTEAAEGGRRRAFAVAGVAAVACVAALAGVVAIATNSAEDPESAAVTKAGTCNGSRGLCAVPLNEVVFAGTHNSFSAADSPGWFIANQRRNIPRQLRDGIRLFLLDAHWGVEGGNGRVKTDFHTEQRDRNRVVAALPPKILKAAERLAGRVGLRGEGGKRELFLCHTVCELGATRMVNALTDIREFLDKNRGEVAVIFMEPYVTPQDIEKSFKESGLDKYVATLDRDEPLPTLGQLVRSNERVIVLTEKDADGTVPWYIDGFSLVQDTPLKATKASQLSCKRFRGSADSPLLMLNHWADLFPPRLQANRPFQRERFILDRAHRCARVRGVTANLIAVDYYDQGRLIPAVAALNEERVRAVRERQRAQTGQSG
jgi:hypothetical protein